MVARVAAVPLDPGELRRDPTSIPLAQQRPYRLDEILVLDGPVPGHPPVPLPVHVPLGHARDRVLAVGPDLERRAPVDDLEGTKDGRQLGALVGLLFALESLREVSVSPVSNSA